MYAEDFMKPVAEEVVEWVEEEDSDVSVETPVIHGEWDDTDDADDELDEESDTSLDWGSEIDFDETTDDNESEEESDDETDDEEVDLGWLSAGDTETSEGSDDDDEDSAKSESILKPQVVLGDVDVLKVKDDEFPTDGVKVKVFPCNDADMWSKVW